MREVVWHLSLWAWLVLPQHDKFHPWPYRYHGFILLYGGMELLCVYLPQLLHLSFCWGHPGCFNELTMGSNKQDCLGYVLHTGVGQLRHMDNLQELVTPSTMLVPESILGSFGTVVHWAILLASVLCVLIRVWSDHLSIYWLIYSFLLHFLGSFQILKRYCSSITGIASVHLSCSMVCLSTLSITAFAVQKLFHGITLANRCFCLPGIGIRKLLPVLVSPLAVSEVGVFTVQIPIFF